MKLSHVAAVALGVALSTGCGDGGNVALNTFADSASYAVGMDIGAAIVDIRDSIDLDLVQRGLKDVAEGKLAALSEPEAGAVLQTFAAQMRQAQQQRMAGQLDENVRAGQAYREQNGAREGVVTTASGLQYEVLQRGEGPRPGPTDLVRVHYRGSLIDGSEFESSYDGDPAEFRLNQVISGWTEALQLMNAGSKFRIVLPPELAYGASGGPGGPNSTLIFEVELLSFQS
jgi:FKBP-type peptidyl-prolyl cis-trans isomerase FkpA/FKBP-type peptidyl-prolyl cis-trans isomerase FklB